MGIMPFREKSDDREKRFLKKGAFKYIEIRDYIETLHKDGIISDEERSKMLGSILAIPVNGTHDSSLIRDLTGKDMTDIIVRLAREKTDIVKKVDSKRAERFLKFMGEFGDWFIPFSELNPDQKRIRIMRKVGRNYQV